MTGHDMTCPRCEHTWTYKGDRPYCTCPWCHTTVRVHAIPLPKAKGSRRSKA